MKDTKQKQKEKPQEVSQHNSSEPFSQELNPYVKGILYIGGVVLVVWASQYAFNAFAGAITAFKKLRKSIQA